MAGIIDTQVIAQVALIVKDVETTKRKFAEFLGVSTPPTIDAGEYSVTQTVYNGEPAPDANCLMAFFGLGSLQLELIQPNDAPSVWRDYLMQHGEGVHHLAFKIKDMKDMVAKCENFGMTLVQKGEYGSANGRYAYLDSYADLKCLIELLEEDDQ
jgi:methylmalonyl-CoA/ethylmalonyl-CoA epimerase